MPNWSSGYEKGQWWVHVGPYPGPYVVAYVGDSPVSGKHLATLIDSDGARWTDPAEVSNVESITEKEWFAIVGGEHQAPAFTQVTKPMEIRRFNNIGVK
jgi:hypothetical protein